jgi:hypothetical protein
MPRCGARSMKMSPLGQEGLQKGFGAVTENLVWVVDPETHPGASRDPSEGGDFQERGPETARESKLRKASPAVGCGSALLVRRPGL